MQKLELREDVKFHITWVGSPLTLNLIHNFHPSVNIQILQKFQFRQADFDIVVDLQGNLRTKLMLLKFMVFSKTKCFSMEKKQLYRNQLIFRSRLFGRFYPPNRTSTTFFQWELMVGCLKNSLRNFFDVETLDSIAARPYLTTANKTLSIALAPGAQHPTKRMPEELFTKAIDGLAKNREQAPFKIYLLGDQNDFELCERLRLKFKANFSVENKAGACSLTETCLILSQCELTLSNDSGIAHLSEACGTPVISFFGPTVEQFGFSPWMKKSFSVSAKLGCRPCSKHGKLACRYGDNLCFRLIEPEATTQIMSY